LICADGDDTDVIPRKTILAVDDEPKILEAVAAYLRSRGYAVLTAENGRKALELFENNTVSLVLLDLMLPDMPGEEVCAAIRKKSRVPVIMLTAKAEEASQVDGLLLGADDYVSKPFSLKVLAARMEAVLRRAADDLVPLLAKSSWRNGDLVVDCARGAVFKRGGQIHLTPSEGGILAALLKYPGRTFSREELITIVFGEDFRGYDRAVDTHVKNLRQKIEDDSKAPVYVLTVHGLGYTFGGE
jgi:DNA-binding response OmpR family regulator